MTYRGFLAELLMAECDDRGRRRSERRIKAACFPRQKELRAFDFQANPNITSETLATLATCEWVRKGQPLCLTGDSGTGKSHLLIALGTEAAMAGYRVRYVLAAKLVNELVEAADDKQLTKTIARYGRVDLLCIDELGYMELGRPVPAVAVRWVGRGSARQFQRAGTGSAERLVQNPGTTLAHPPIGRLPSWSGQYFEQSGGVDACGEAEKSLRQLAGGLHGGVVAHAVE